MSTDPAAWRGVPSHAPRASFRVSSANVNKALRGAPLSGAIGRAAAGADVVTWQEVESPEHIADIRALAGFRTYWPGGLGKNAANATPISWRADRFTMESAGVREVGRGIGGVQPNRYLVYVILRDRLTGKSVAVQSAHTISGVWRGLARRYGAWSGRDRRQESAHELAAIAHNTLSLSHRADMVIGGGDLNRRTKLSPAQLGAEHVAYAGGPTHGRSWYDLLWLTGGHASNTRRTRTASDHEVLSATITPTATIADWPGPGGYV